MKKAPERKSVSLEDLLRLKRAERPHADSWTGWQGEMRAKLAEAAQEQPSWLSRTLPRVWISIARWHLPLGVTALAALSFIVVREYKNPLPALPGPAPVLNVAASADKVAPSQMSAPLLSELRNPGWVAADPLPSEGGVTGSLAMIGTRDRTSRSRVEEVIAANLEHFRSLETKNSSLSYTLHGKVPAQPSEVQAEAASTERNSRRERLLGFYPAAAWNSSEQSTSREELRAPSRLSEDQFTEGAVHRLEARGDMFSLRF